MTLESDISVERGDDTCLGICDLARSMCDDAASRPTHGHAAIPPVPDRDGDRVNSDVTSKYPTEHVSPLLPHHDRRAYIMPPVKNAAASSSKPTSTKSASKAKPVAGKGNLDLASDIDSIFAGPSKVRSKPQAADGPTTPAPVKAKNKKRPADSETTTTASVTVNGDADKKKKKKAKKVNPADERQAPVASRVVEVVDTSVPKVKEVMPAASAVKAKGKGKKTKETEEDEMFADSRGTGPRESRLSLSNCSARVISALCVPAGRKTEEGFLIYKEAELQIDPEAGGTPLCPFDCECCASPRLDRGVMRACRV